MPGYSAGAALRRAPVPMQRYVARIRNATSRTTYSAPQVIRYVKPGETVTIKMYKGSKPANAPANLYEARDVLKYLAPTPAQQPTPPHG